MQGPVQTPSPPDPLEVILGRLFPEEHVEGAATDTGQTKNDYADGEESNHRMEESNDDVALHFFFR